MKRLIILIILLCPVLLLCGCGIEAPPIRETGLIESRYDAESITSVMNAQDIAGLENFTKLKTLDLRGSTCYEEIQDYIDAHPDVDVTFTIHLSAGFSGMNIDNDVSELVLDNYGFIPALMNCSRYLTRLQKICLRIPLENTKYADMLSEVFPGAEIECSFQIFGMIVSSSDEELILSRLPIGNAGIESLREILPYLTSIKSIRIEMCGIDDAVLAQLRDDFPDISIAWRIFFGPWSIFTDAEKIFASGSVTDADTGSLKYCRDMKYIDLGHNYITDISFVSYMPKLEVAIFACGSLSDISPLADCKELEYLEIFSSYVSDISPLSQCTKLRHLNIGYLPGLRDLTPLYNIDTLERVWCAICYVPYNQRKEIQELHPDCEFCFSNINPTDGGWRYDKNGNRVERYELLAQQFGYDELDYSWW